MSHKSYQSLEDSVRFFNAALAKMGQQKDLDKIRKSDTRLIVFKAEYDHIEEILDVLKIPYYLASASELNDNELKLENATTVFLDCPASGFNRTGLSKIKDYVGNGGKLVTTDWSVEHVIQQIFPATIRRLKAVVTNDECVTIEPYGELGKQFIGLEYEDASPKWWLERESYPIEILNTAIVKPIITSQELNQKYGSPYIAVAFPYGNGAVMHFVSHLVAQRIEARDARDSMSSQYFAERTQTIPLPGVSETATVADLETGYSAISTVYNIITAHVEDLGKTPSEGKSTVYNIITAHAEDLGKTPSEGKSCQLELIVGNYTSVSFTGQEKSNKNTAVYNLIKSPVAIGRGDHNNVTLEDSMVSRNHAKVFYDGKECYLEDLGSRHGTFLNGEKISTKTQIGTSGKIAINPGTIHFKLLN